MLVETAPSAATTCRRLEITWTASIACLSVLLLWTYWPVIPDLVRQWWDEDEYSHGFLVPLIAGWLAWTKWPALGPPSPRPAYSGLAAMTAALLLYVVGLLGADLFLQRISIVAMLGGVLLFAAGWETFRTLAFPLGYLLLMVPLPGIVFNSVSFPLQLLAAQIATATLQAVSVPVFREGNVLHLAAASLDVEEACSGIRSLLSLTALALLMAYLSKKTRAGKLVVVALIVPVAIAANVFRVAMTGLLAHYVSVDAALGAFHDIGGFVVFFLAAALLVGSSRLLRRLGLR